MDTIILVVLLFVIISQCGLIFWILEKFGEEKKVLLSQIKDATDKLYFVRTNDFITNKIADQPKTEEKPKDEEEKFIPLEDVPIEDLARAYGAEVPKTPNGR